MTRLSQASALSPHAAQPLRQYPDARALRRLALLGIAASSSLALAACQQAGSPQEKGGDTPDTSAPATPAGSLGGAATSDITADDTTPANASTAPQAAAATTALDPPAPGEVGGLPDDRTLVAEGKIDPKSPQGAAGRLQNYAALLDQGKYDEAFAFWGDSGKASGMSKAAFADSFAKYSEVHALIGGPQDPEGAAGSTYVTVPMQLYGRLKAGGTFNMVGPMTMRRVNDVPGATPAQLQWHISDAKLKPAGKVKEVPIK